VIDWLRFGMHMPNIDPFLMLACENFLRHELDITKKQAPAIGIPTMPGPEEPVNTILGV